MNLIQVKNLVCSYSSHIKDKVLEIADLNIEKGKIVFLVGASGSGKSTFLETLGLMNNTLRSGDIILDHKDGKISFSELWRESSNYKLNEVRRKNLSFIFQNTNLMENFTAYENICLSRMIKEGSDQQTAMEGAERLMQQVGLPPSEVSISALSVNLSGGQRQRVSFARALNNNFSLLLCDEPTGNLDEINAQELLNIICANIQNDRTAIVVSHDINLALQFADQIVVISKDAKKGYGEILPENIYKKEYWNQLSPDELKIFREHIISFFQNSREKKFSHKSEEKLKWHKAYQPLFMKKESRILYGKNNLNIILVMSITMLTLLASGFANGSLDYIKKKYDDPFINWLTIHLPDFRNGEKDITFYTKKLLNESNLKRFSIKQIDTYKDFWLRFFSNKSLEHSWSKGRTISYDDRILEDILGFDNLILGQSFKEENDLSIILTEKMLKKLNYSLEDKFIYLNNSEQNPFSKTDSIFRVPIPIRAIVKSIPGKLDFIVTDNFYLAFKNFENSVFDFKGDQSRSIALLIGPDKAKAEKLKVDIDRLLESTSFDCLTNIDTCDQVSSVKLWMVSVTFNLTPEDFKVTEDLFNSIKNLPSYDKKQIIRILYYGNPQLSNIPPFDNYLSINLGEGGLDQIDSISKFIYDEFNENVEEGDQMSLIQIDSSMIKEKKNFNYVGKTTFFIAAMLIIFAVLAISLFLSNLLKSHLTRVKMNIGTYKAFGLSDQESTRIYLLIMLRFIGICITGGFLLACGLGFLIEYLVSYNLRMEGNVEYFRIYDFNTLILIVLILGISISVSYLNIHKILSKTPGDLIYNR